MSLLKKFSILSLLLIIPITLIIGYIAGKSCEMVVLDFTHSYLVSYYQTSIKKHFSSSDFNNPYNKSIRRDFGKEILHFSSFQNLENIIIWNSKKQIIWAHKPLVKNETYDSNTFNRALKGRSKSVIIESEKINSFNYDKKTEKILLLYIPFSTKDSSDNTGVLELYFKIDKTLQNIVSKQKIIWVHIIILMGVLYFVLFEITKSGSQIIQKQKDDIIKSHNELSDSYMDTIKVLAAAIDTKDKFNQGHSERVADISVKFGHFLGLSEEDLKLLRQGALLHDIGKIGIPEELLNKIEILTEKEFSIIKTHPKISAVLLEKVRFLSKVIPIIISHHERMDGTGYPNQIIEKDIPYLTKIITLVDSYDAMTSNRPYRKALSHEDAIKELIEGKGTQFNSELVDEFLQFIKTDKDLA